MDVGRRKWNRRLRRMRAVGWRLFLVFAFAFGMTVIAYQTFLQPAVSATLGPIEVRADVLSVYDGDTFTARAYIWPGHVVEVSIRIRGIDTPEIRGKCDREKALALFVRDFVREKILNTQVRLKNIRLGKYAGRVIADVYYPAAPNRQDNLAAILLIQGYARAYDGGSRQGWCD